MITLEGVSISLSGRRVVHELSFDARPGALTAIVGPNGSGKTTTLKAISGECRHDGRISYAGRDLKSMSPAQLALERGVLQQSVSIGFPFRVREILEMGIVAGSVHSRQQADAIMSAALEKVDLAGFENRVATALSGGEQSRMHLARVLCQIPDPVRDGRPCWLFLDEPVASLDVRHQLAIMRLAKDFAKAGGGVIAVMHDLNLTAMFADHIVMMRQGRLHASGTPDEVLTAGHLSSVYDCPLAVECDPATGLRRIFPSAAAA